MRGGAGRAGGRRVESTGVHDRVAGCSAWLGGISTSGVAVWRACRVGTVLYRCFCKLCKVQRELAEVWR